MANWNLPSARPFQFYGRRPEIHFFLSDFRRHGFWNLNLARSQTVILFFCVERFDLCLDRNLDMARHNLILFKE